MTSWYRMPFRVPFISMVSFSSSLGGPHHSKFHWSQTRSLLSPHLPLGDHFSSGTCAALGHRALFPSWSLHLPPTVPTGRGVVIYKAGAGSGEGVGFESPFSSQVSVQSCAGDLTSLCLRFLVIMRTNEHLPHKVVGGIKRV